VGGTLDEKMACETRDAVLPNSINKTFLTDTIWCCCDAWKMLSVAALTATDAAL